MLHRDTTTPKVARDVTFSLLLATHVEHVLVTYYGLRMANFCPSHYSLFLMQILLDQIKTREKNDFWEILSDSGAFRNAVC